MKKPLLLLILFSFCMITCNKKEESTETGENTPILIKAGYMCGWGAGEDSLIISSTMIRYVYTVPQKSPIPEINKSRPVTPAEWDMILNSIDFNIFQNLDYNSCNICVDGCDEWISIKNYSASHQIRYGLGMKIDSIKPLQDLLSQLRSEFRK